MYRFFFPKKNKIAIETQITSSIDNEGFQYTNRKFYTFRALKAYFFSEIKKYFKDLYEFYVFKPFPEYRIALIKGAITIGTTTSGVNSTDTITVSCTPTGSNCSLVIGVGGVRSLSSAVFNTSENLTLLTEQSAGSGTCRMGYLTNPTQTTANVVATLASPGATSMGITILSGTNTSSLLDAQAGSAYSGVSSVSTSITTNFANSIIIDVISGQNNPTPNGSQTSLWTQAPSNFDEGSYKLATTAGSYSMDWTFSASGGAHKVGAFREVVASVASPYVSNLAFMGAG